MSSKNPEFDCLLGGRIELPSNVNLLKFTAARCMEIQCMKKELSEVTGTKLAFQKLPKHMRRRVMSHNAKRLPRRLRDIHLNQLKKSGMPPKQKRPSRKYRRRPRNLTEDYARRQRKIKWLETHIWHAKRFHMVERWGYKLPESPCDKAFRACYRATSKHCLINDISYYGCIEINGDESIIVNNFKSVTDASCGLSVAAKAFIRGNREGEFTMFKVNSATAIGKINFNWKPNLNNESKRTIWLWVHPAYIEEVLTNLECAFTADKVETDGLISYVNKTDKTSIKDKRLELNRFRLTGPLCNAVLHNVLRPVDLNQLESNWLNTYVSNDEYRQIFAEQLQFWKNIENLSSPAQLSPRMIVSLIVSDPRYNLTLVKKKILPDCSQFNENCLSEVPQNISLGPIWDEDICKHVKENKISNAAIADLRSKLFVPGTELGIPGSPLPVTLVQRPGNTSDKLGYCSGWDVIAPSGWAQPIWIALIMSGARPGGLRETDSMQFEMSNSSFLAPDTQAGREEEKRVTLLHTKRFFSLPPNKRPNFNKLAITSPFCCDWKLLVQEWMTGYTSGISEFVVLRNKTQLLNIRNILNGKTKNQIEIDFNTNYIVPVRITLAKKGRPDLFAVICLPTHEDISNKKEPTEPLLEDTNQIRRKEMRDAHQILLKKLGRQRKKARNNGKKIPVDTEALQEYTRIMRELWLPQTLVVRKSCSRDVLGFVTKGNFSFTIGGSAGDGYITLASLRSLLNKKFKNRVLVRNTNSRQYRFATLDVVI